MTTATIRLPEEIKQLALARAAASGHPTLDDYLQALIVADAAGPISPELEAHLLAALETPSREMTATDWEEKRRLLAVAQAGEPR